MVRGLVCRFNVWVRTGSFVAGLKTFEFLC